MELFISGVGFGLFCLAIGLAVMGYFIGNGLQNFHKTDEVPDYPIFIKESELEYYLDLSKEEIKELITKYPDIPKVELGGSNFFPEKQLLEWFSSNDNFKH